ncbi:hypothetical protein HY338_00910 [Candidatus Gottesmanbacteria bacterium]|nr:hypothetical protein [Candidatus Gottesmanbacteria bacterium]
MGNFYRNDRGGDRGGRRFGGRDSGPREMHHATCAECGNDCEVPFRPSEDRPVYCSNCFEKRRNEEGGSSDSGRRNFSRPNFDNRRSFSGGGNRDNTRPNPSGNGQVADQLKSINFKLDKILGVLEPNTKQSPVADKKESILDIDTYVDKSLALKNDETEIVAQPKIKKSKTPKKVKVDKAKIEVSLED